MRKSQLRPGDFFMLWDYRQERHLPYGPNKSDDPSTDISMRLSAQRKAYYASFAKEGRHAHFYACFSEPTIPMPNELVHNTIYYANKQPKELAHFLTFIDRAEMGNVYFFVSPDWRSAVEHLEPGVHEFFPVELCFSDDKTVNYFVMRIRQIEDFLIGKSKRFYFVKGVWRTGSNEIMPEAKIMADPDLISGKHWLRSPWNYAPFASRQLARALQPLLPPSTLFAPIELLKR